MILLVYFNFSARNFDKETTEFKIIPNEFQDNLVFRIKIVLKITIEFLEQLQPLYIIHDFQFQYMLHAFDRRYTACPREVVTNNFSGTDCMQTMLIAESSLKET